jgi:hypothetical protein
MLTNKGEPKNTHLCISLEVLVLGLWGFRIGGVTYIYCIINKSLVEIKIVENCTWQMKSDRHGKSMQN